MHVPLESECPMNATRLAFHDVVLLEPKVLSDPRGVFFESYNQKAFEAATGLSHSFVQDNHSVSAKGVLRGLHYQLPPHAQGKLIRVVVGAVLDVVVDSQGLTAFRALARGRADSAEPATALGAGGFCARISGARSGQRSAL